MWTDLESSERRAKAFGMTRENRGMVWKRPFGYRDVAMGLKDFNFKGFGDGVVLKKVVCLWKRLFGDGLRLPVEPMLLDKRNLNEMRRRRWFRVHVTV